MRDVQVMMLAAGLGTRLWPLTEGRGKPAVPFLGRPLVRGMLDWLVSHGATRFVVNTHHRAASIHHALQDVPAGIDVAFSHEETILGTAGCLALARQRGLLDTRRTTLIVNAKLVTSLDVTSALHAHRSRGARITMILRSNLQREAFTSVRVENDWVQGFGPSRVPEGPHPLLFTGVHFLEPEVLTQAEPQFSDTIKDLYPPQIMARKVLAHVDDSGTWLEASTLERYLDLQLQALGSGVHQTSSAQIDPQAEVSRVVLGARSSIGSAQLSDSVLLDGARIEDGVRLHRVVVGENVVVPRDLELSNVVIVDPASTGEPPQPIPNLKRKYGLILVPLNAS